MYISKTIINKEKLCPRSLKRNAMTPPRGTKKTIKRDPKWESSFDHMLLTTKKKGRYIKPQKQRAPKNNDNTPPKGKG